MESLRWFWEKITTLPSQVVYGVLGTIGLLLLVYYPIGMLIEHKVDDNLDFEATGVFAAPPQGSQAIAITTALLNRELKEHSWTPSDPFFKPGALLDRMPAYQIGIVSALARFAVEMTDQVGRTRGSSKMDDDLAEAAGKLKYPADVFFFDRSISILPVASSDSQYKSAIKSLQRYNARLVSGQAVYERRADNLMVVLDRIASDLGSSSAALDDRTSEKNRRWMETDADTLYYDVKGRMYAYYLILRELRKDYADVIREKNLDTAWDQTVRSLGEGAKLRSFWVFNAAPDSQFVPSHLAAEGFYLLRARTQIKELSSILMR